MAFVKILKNSAFFKRYQVPKRRRREGRTDYQARRKMVRQDKNKFNNRKYRLIVRFTNTKVICQVAFATILGDITIVSAQSTELEKFGVKGGFKNYAAAYATGLLVARRTLQHFGMDEDFKGKDAIDGEEYHVEEEEEGERRPLKCILDVGLRRTCVGARLWGALKGAADGGLHVPHNTKNFPGHKAADDKGGDDEYDAEVHKAKIFGNHVAEYMSMLQEEDATKYEAHFAKYIEGGVDGDGLQKMYEDAHSKIKASPKHERKANSGVKNERKGNNIVPSDGNPTYKRSVKLTLRQRREKVSEKIAAAQARALVEE